MSVRTTASGAVFVALLSFMTAPASACDDRFIKKCESDSAAAWAADQPAEPAVKRKPAPRVRTPAPMAYKPKPAPQAAPAQAGPELASAETRPVQLDTPAARRFRGFIDPVSMSVNPFEGLRKPRPDAAQLVPAPTIPPNDMSGVAAADEGAGAPLLVTSKASSQVMAPVAAVAPAVAAPAAAKIQPAPAPAVAIAQVAPPAIDPNAVPIGPVVSQAPPAGDAPSSGFGLHHLMLALCGALGAAGAVRFIVGT